METRTFARGMPDLTPRMLWHPARACECRCANFALPAAFFARTSWKHRRLCPRGPRASHVPAHGMALSFIESRRALFRQAFQISDRRRDANDAEANEKSHDSGACFAHASAEREESAGGQERDSQSDSHGDADLRRPDADLDACIRFHRSRTAPANAVAVWRERIRSKRAATSAGRNRLSKWFHGLQCRASTMWIESFRFSDPVREAQAADLHASL